jgi:2-succinyl-6-hydroxy-2,4-cyclohexadiene-1-carboxylate synthase
VRVLLVPGFAQTGSVWDATIGQLAVEAAAIEVPDEPDFATTAMALGISGGPGLYAGYSMGGRLALYLALEQPATVEHLILVSSGPGIAGSGERRARRDADEELAAWIENHSLDEFVDRWAQQPIFGDVPSESIRSHRLSSPSEISSQLRRLGQGSQPSLWERLGELQMPVTFIVGEHDDKYGAIAARAADLISGPVEIHTVMSVGHALIHTRATVLARTILTAASHQDHR